MKNVVDESHGGRSCWMKVMLDEGPVDEGHGG